MISRKKPLFIVGFVLLVLVGVLAILLGVKYGLYRTEVTRYKAYINLELPEKGPFGNIRLPQMITGFAAVCEKGRFVCKPQDGVIKLPVGEYRIDYWSIVRKDNEGNNWKLRGCEFQPEKGLFKVSETEEAELTIGEPIISTLNALDKDGMHYFRHEMKGQLEERIVLTCNDERPQAPKIFIKSEDGTYNWTSDFRYG